MAVAKTRYVTREEYDALPEDERCELLDGELSPLPPRDCDHGEVAVRLGARLLRLLSEGLGGRLMAEVDVPISPTRVRRADLAYVSPEHLGRIRSARLEGPPDLVIEIVSRDDPGRDYVDKAADYARAGVDHYWIVDPQARRVRLLERQDDAYAPGRGFGPDDPLESPLLQDADLRPRDFLPA